MNGMDARDQTRMTSSDSPGMVMGPDSYRGGVPNNSMSMVMPISMGMMPGMQLSFNPMLSSAPKPTDTSRFRYHGDGEMVKKKRGRPRKYGLDGTALALSPASRYSDNPLSEPSTKRQGCPPGSGKKQQLAALGSAGIGFTPHVIIVKAGEDVASKIMAFSQQGPRAICILSANGSICNATLRQPATLGGTVTYEGRFEIISLSGSFMLTDNASHRSRTGGLSVSLAGSDGRVLGGVVAGILMAGTPVQVVVGSFISEGKKPMPKTVTQEPLSAPPQMPGFGAGAASASCPPSQGTSCESSDGPGSPINQSGGTSNWNKSNQHLQSMASYSSAGWFQSASRHPHNLDM